MTELSFANDKRGYYVPSDLAKKSVKEMSKEYTRFRDIMNKRVKRQEAAGILDKEEIEALKRTMPKLSELKQYDNYEETLRSALSVITRAVNKAPSTLKKAREYKEYKRNKFQEASREFGFSTSAVDEKAFWKFVDYTKNIIKDNIFYWSDRKMKFLFSNSDLVEKLNRLDFSSVIREVNEQNANAFKKDLDTEMKEVSSWLDF